MSKLTKDHYSRRNENAARRMTENATVQTLTTDQHELLSNICSLRHELHSNQDDLFCCEGSNYKPFWEQISNLSDRARQLSLDGCPCIDIESLPNDHDYDEVDFWDMEDWWSDDEDDDLRSNALNAVLEAAQEYNSKIESFLAKIDNKHGTNYCPTGATRIF